MIKLTQDRRTLREGYCSVWVNPADVSAVVRNPSSFDTDNKSMIILKNGEKITVQDYPESVVATLEDKP